MNFFLLIPILFVSLAILINCKDDCSEPNETPFKAIYLDIKQSQNDKCGHEIRLLDGFDNLSKLTPEPVGDSLFYAENIPLQYGDTFYFNGRGKTIEEMTLCDPFGVRRYGQKQIYITKIKKL